MTLYLICKVTCVGCGKEFAVQPLSDTIPAAEMVCGSCKAFEHVMELWSQPKSWEKPGMVQDSKLMVWGVVYVFVFLVGMYFLLR